MDTLRLGKSELRVSRIGFGGIPIQRLTEEEAVSVVTTCINLGITFLDTANAYTTSEERIGKAIAGQREHLIIATKSGSRDRAGIEAHLKQSLKQLGVEWIDLYQLHNVSDFDTYRRILEPDGALSVALEAKSAGLVRHVGVTSHSMDVAKEAVKSDRFETVMFPFNFVTSEPADQLLPLAREHDVGFIAMKPLAGGMLDNVNIAFKYLLQFPDVLPIPGIQEADEIRQIMSVVEGPREMTEAEHAEMQRMREEMGTRFCRRCDYCQPCSEGIPISMVTNFTGFLRRMPLERLFSGGIAAGMEKAASCSKCGDCEPRCPYDLPIMEMVEENAALYQAEKKKYLERTATR